MPLVMAMDAHHTSKASFFPGHPKRLVSGGYETVSIVGCSVTRPRSTSKFAAHGIVRKCLTGKNKLYNKGDKLGKKHQEHRSNTILPPLVESVCL